MKLNIAVLPGDGIGPEVTQQALKILDAISEKYGHHFKYEKAAIGATAIEEFGVPELKPLQSMLFVFPHHLNS